MKTSNKFCALALVAGLLGTTTAFAQQDDIRAGELRYRVEAGITSSKISNFGIGEAQTGFRVGATVSLPFTATAFAVNSGLIFTTKGENQGFYLDKKDASDKTLRTSNTTKTRLYYLQLPVEASFRINLSEDHKIYVAVGPYLGYALGGKSKNFPIEQKVEDINLPIGRKVEDINLFKAEETGGKGFNRFELGIGGNLMYAYKDIFLKGGVEYSVLGVANQGAVYGQVLGGSAHHGLAYVTIGYQF